MTNLNNVYLIGRIVKDSILEQTAEHKYAKFAIAVNRDVKTPNGEWVSTPTYIDLAIFDNYAEKMYKWLRKGTLVLVHGYIKQRQWIKDDQKISTLGIGVTKLELLSSAKKIENATEALADEVEEVTDIPTPDNDYSTLNVEPSDDTLTGIF